MFGNQNNICSTPTQNKAPQKKQERDNIRCPESQAVRPDF